MGYRDYNLHFTDLYNLTSTSLSSVGDASSSLALLSYGSTHHALDSTGYTITQEGGHSTTMDQNVSIGVHNGTLEDMEATTESQVAMIFKATAMVTVMAMAVFGNMLVIISVLRFERLRIIANSFIASLAIADLTVAMLVMPFNASMEIAGKWVFGRVYCDIFNANDVLFSTASLLHLCCISMDRYIAITDPFHYESKMTRRRVAIMLVVAWGASALISHIPIHMGWYTTEEHWNSRTEDECPFIVNKIYAVISSSISFWTPAIVMVFTYVKIFREARKQEKQIYALTRTANPSSSNLQALNSNGTGPHSSRNGSYQAENARLTQERKKMKREHKAAKTLGIIMGAFLVCWLPFFITYLTTALCGPACDPPPVLVSVLFWVGYFNSALNPLIYAFFNRDFRNAFKRLLGCHRNSCTLCDLCCRCFRCFHHRDRDNNYNSNSDSGFCCRRGRNQENLALHSGAAFTELCTRPCNSRSDGSASSIRSSSPKTQNRTTKVTTRTSYDTVH